MSAPIPSGEVLTEIDGAVGVVALNRPQVLNALSYDVLEQTIRALEALDADARVRCMVLTGGEKAFAAGADIKELENADIPGMAGGAQMLRWDRLRRLAKPLIAAVGGYALGGGCELAMACDIIVAAENAVFGQPEILIGVIPGAGGTQRLTRQLGKYRALDMILTGRRLSAQEALAAGLVSRVYPPEALLREAKKLAAEIAEKPPIAARLAKEAVSRALDMDLDTALSYERKLFYLLFGTEDQKEGMRAFREKRRANFTGK